MLPKAYFNKEVEDKFLSVINKKYYKKITGNECEEVDSAYILPAKRYFDENGDNYYT